MGVIELAPTHPSQEVGNEMYNNIHGNKGKETESIALQVRSE
jgi:hypothetical protein